MQASSKTRTRGAIVSLALVATMVGCGGSEPAGVAPDSTPQVSSSSSEVLPTSVSPTGHQAAVDRAVRQLDRFVDAWAERGWDAAARRHLWRFKAAGAGQAGDLRRGRVTDHELRSWSGPRRFELLVTFDLRFVGSPGIWQQGDNDVFVTVHPGKPGPYRLELSSGPAPAG